MIDTHAHLYLEEFSSDLEEVVHNARIAGVSKILSPNIDLQSFDDLLKECKKFKNFLIPMIGYHPTSVNENYKEELNRLFANYKPNFFCGIGEIGIDLYWDQTFIEQQKEAFAIQVDFAIQYNLPIVIHARESFAEIFDVLKRFDKKNIRGVFHSFTGSRSEIDIIDKLGTFYFGINGIVTFKNATLKNVLSTIGLERILLETDAPYLAPVPFRGKRNESAYIHYICNFIAEHLGQSFEEIDRQTSQNANTLFNLTPYV